MHHSQKLSQLHSEEDEEFDIVRPGIVHRLDKDTSGLLVVAKDETTHQKLAKQFAAKTSEREYNAIVWGTFKQRSGVIDAPLGRSKSDRKKVAVMMDGKKAVTEYEVIEGQKRIQELAQMMSGKKETDISRKHAEEMLTRVRP
jgi:23S rRNA-/tRNA-specific pseudouridylate synthase